MIMATAEYRDQPIDYTEIPSALKEWAAENNYVLSWELKVSEFVSMEVLHERYPLDISELPDDQRKVAEKMGTKTDENFIQRSDCYLAYQPIAAWEERERHGAMRRMRQESAAFSADSGAEMIEDIAGQTGVKGKAHFVPGEVSDAGSHVHAGSAAEATKQMLRKVKKSRRVQG